MRRCRSKIMVILAIDNQDRDRRTLEMSCKSQRKAKSGEFHAHIFSGTIPPEKPN